MTNGFRINKQGIRKMTKEIERELARNPVRVPLKVDRPGGAGSHSTTVNNYNAPIVTVNGDHAQLAWDAGHVTQTQERTEEVVQGYEQLAQTVSKLLNELPNLPLDEDDRADARDNADVILDEVVKPEPEKSVVKRAATFQKGLLAPIAAGVVTGTTAEMAEVTRQLIEGLSSALPL